MRRKIYDINILVAVLLICMSACTSKDSMPTSFVVRMQNETGLTFSNTIVPTPQFNMLKYMYFFNGAGIASGDFNDDRLIDLFFTSNQGQNSLFINKGDLKFEDVTKAAAIPGDRAWNTGVSVVDINNDGMLDLYVCRVGDFETLKSRNQLLICKEISKSGIPVYEDQAAEYGLDFSGFSTQAAFFDYDLDGDLDVYLLNHSVHQNGTFAERKSFLGTRHPLAGDRLYKNDNGKFIDYTTESMINSSAIGYGLGIAISDINLDGFPDIYIGNDFHENDYLYINQKDGTFSEELTQRIMHTSQFSMGVDIGDINNDAYPDIISMDMLPNDPYILKRSLGEDAYDVFNLKIRYGYNHQYARNNLQLNRGNGLFSEVGLYAGVDATDWSWAPLWVDFDNDGYKDLFISNGIQKRLNDIDYVNYVSNDELQAKIREGRMSEKDMNLIDKFPEIKIPNKFYRNTGDVVFQDLSSSVSNDQDTYSNGAVYADLDNDGDLDVVVNNVNDAALVYENTFNAKENATIRINAKGPVMNVNAIGSKVYVFRGDERIVYEKYPVKGFQSSMEGPLLIGLGKDPVDSILFVWPDNTYERVAHGSSKNTIELKYRKNLPAFRNEQVAIRSDTLHLFDKVTTNSGLNFRHTENAFVEFDRELLMPHTISAEGPALAVGDINNDGLDDVFIGSAKREKSAVFIQGQNGVLQKSEQLQLDLDSTFEDVDAIWVDVNNDSFPDLVVASGGNEYYGKDKNLVPRLYINDGKGNLNRKQEAFSGIYMTASCVRSIDFDGDGFLDLFIGGRATPWEYGEIPRSYLLRNKRNSTFEDVTERVAPDLFRPGFVTNATVTDIDKNGSDDLLLTLEWGRIIAFLRKGTKFEKKELATGSGWWSFVLPVDIDNDGDLDLIAGNMGLNSRLKATPEMPVSLYFADFDNNGKKEQILTYYVQGKEVLFANKGELDKQLPLLKKKFLYAEDFARATPLEVIGENKISNAVSFKADYFENAILINEGNLKFSMKALPWQAQLTSYRDAVVCDANADGYADILLVGNYFENNVQLGRYDADFGMLLVSDGKGWYNCRLPGTPITGQARQIRKMNTKAGQQYIVARNNDSAMVIFQPSAKK